MICHAKGDYVLLLNPDTLIYEGSLHKSIQVFEENVNICALSCNMIEGNNRLMPIGTLEYPSIRGLWDYLILCGEFGSTCKCKLFGLN